MIFAACSDDGGIRVSNKKDSGCKERLSAASRASIEDGEYLEYSVEKKGDGMYINFKHSNCYFSCDAKSVDVTSRLEENGDVFVHETEISGDGPGLNCICPHDLQFTVGPLEAGEHVVRIYSTHSEYYPPRFEFTLNLSSNVKGKLIHSKGIDKELLDSLFSNK